MENNMNTMKRAALAGFFAGAVAAMLISRKMRGKSCRWAGQMRDEVSRRAAETKDLTLEKFSQIIEEIRPRYAAMKNVSAQELGGLINELKSHWQKIAKVAQNQMKGTPTGPETSAAPETK